MVADIINFVTSEALWTVILTVYVAANAVVALTPTPKDDNLLGKAYKVLEVAGGIVGRAKDLPGQNASQQEWQEFLAERNRPPADDPS